MSLLGRLIRSDESRSTPPRASPSRASAQSAARPAGEGTATPPSLDLDLASYRARPQRRPDERPALAALTRITITGIHTSPLRVVRARGNGSNFAEGGAFGKSQSRSR